MGFPQNELAALGVNGRGLALGVGVDTGGIVERQNLFQRHPERGPEMVYAVVPLPELSMQRGPRNRYGFVGRYAVQAVCQPCVNVEGKGAVREAGYVVLVEWYGVSLEAFPIVER